MSGRTPRAPKPLDREALLSYAARSLGARAQSLSELRARLKRRAARAQDVDEVLASLKQAGYVDDRRFAGSFAQWRQENAGFGKARVLRDLIGRRVAPAVARQAVEAAYEQTDEIELIESFLTRKYRGKDLKTLLAEQKHLASAYRKLRAAGFSGGNSIRVLKRYAAQAESLEDADDAHTESTEL
jgi:regulatory protein